MTQTDEILGLHHQLDGVTAGLGAYELRAVTVLARRIRSGQERYGMLMPGDGRDWLRELSEELLDASIYWAFAEALAEGNPPHEGEGG
jgi:hypothetical protein